MQENEVSKEELPRFSDRLILNEIWHLLPTTAELAEALMRHNLKPSHIAEGIERLHQDGYIHKCGVLTLKGLRAIKAIVKLEEQHGKETKKG